MRRFYVEDGYLVFPVPLRTADSIGVPLWFVGTVFAVVVGFVVVVVLAAMSSKRRENQ
jgi:hypothetical protein